MSTYDEYLKQVNAVADGLFVEGTQGPIVSVTVDCGTVNFVFQDGTEATIQSHYGGEIGLNIDGDEV